MEKKHKVPMDVKEQILNRIKNDGISVKQAAEEHALHEGTIYNWLSKGISDQPSALDYAKLKRENQALKEMLGEVTLELKRTQKNN